MIKTSIHRKLLIVVLIVTLISLPASGGVGDILTLLNTITSTLRGEIGKVLSAIQAVRTTKRTLEQEVVWPVNQINQARASAVQIRTQFTSLTRSIETLPVTSATLANPRQLESLLRSSQSTNLGPLSISFQRVYGAVPAQTDAATNERNLTDVDDAMATGSLKTAIVSDQSSQQMLSVADALEQQAGTTSPGSAPLLTAQASVANLQNQAYLQRMLAAELRQEASRLAHDNAMLKRNAENGRQFRNAMQQILTRP